ncbi:MAG TPA: acetyl-CoA carboxylase biotin carboxylase subunit, partial [Spirochaetia bacterium]|nr:acetyl-CoA carboxylase biotin carboxylase subunit [Spirochaetia bacterium]
LAAGLTLDVQQKDVEVNGWAIECRINAENPETFLPCPGQVHVYQPPGGYGVRVDSALYPGCVVPPHYDALVAKLLVWGQNREEALERMSRALAEFRIEGIDTTIPFHLRILHNPRFRAGAYQTDFVHRFLMENSTPAALPDPVMMAAIGAALSAYLEKERTPRRVAYLTPQRQSLWRADALRESMRQYF